MARFLLDTNIVSFLLKAANPILDHRFNCVPKSAIAISVISEAEVRFGLALLPPEAKLHQTAEKFLSEIEIEAWDSTCAVHYARLAATQRREGKPLSAADTMIAAHALAHNFTLVTNDQALHRVKGLKTEDWTKGPQHE